MVLSDIECSKRFLYKFRPFSILSQKELIYNELFFAQRSELNDPFDTLLTYVFGPEPEKYGRLIVQALGAELLNDSQIRIATVSEYLGSKSRNLGDLLDDLSSQSFLKVLLGAIRPGEQFVKLSLVQAISDGLKYYIHWYIDRFAYTYSLSYDCQNSTVWSHYADQHRGFALVFMPYRNTIWTDPTTQDIHFVDDDGRVNYFDSQKKFQVRRVSYSEDPIAIDAFLCFTPDIYGVKNSPEFFDKIHLTWEKSATTKHLSWKYEEEARLVDYDADYISRIEKNGKVARAAFARTLHYDPTQLVGIVFGSKMPEDSRKTLKSLVLDSRGQTLLRAGLVPFFYFLEARSTEDSYDLSIRVNTILDSGNGLMRIEDYPNKYTRFLEILPHLKKGRTKHRKQYAVYGSYK